MTTLQEYLNERYPTKEDKEKVKEISLFQIKKEMEEQSTYEKMEGGELNLEEYKNLEVIGLIGNSGLKSPLTNLKIKNLAKLVEVFVSENNLSDLDLSGCCNLSILLI